jgi:eukaryotic-like serine/threonine-protein kinase
MPPARAPLATVLRFGAFELDLDAEELRKAGARVKLQKQPCQVLKFLLERSGEIVTREELRSEIWSADTFVDFDNSLNTAVNKLRDALGDTSNSPRFVETIPRRGYRFIAPVTTNGHEAIAVAVAPVLNRARWKIVAAASVVLALLAVLVRYSRLPHPPAAKNTILLANFLNRTGDAIFDGTLRQGLSVQLDQSPLLRAIPDEQINETLQMMGQSRNIELSPQIAREVCERNNAAVALDGSIALMGTRYELVLRAVDCASGNLLASVEARAQDKDHVLDAVSKLASDMRGKLGESLSSVLRFNTPLATATTPSLEALRCYTQGFQVQYKKFDYSESLSWFQKAIELDPNFAMAYWAIGDVYAILGETNSAVQYTQKAFELREHVSEREKALIEAHYYYYVLGDVEKARRSCELFSTLYPYSEDAHTSVAAFAETVGQYDVGLTEYTEALRLAPRRSFLYRDVAYTYLALDRLENASAVVRQAHEMNLDSNLEPVLYSMAFYRDDRSEMARQVTSVQAIRKSKTCFSLWMRTQLLIWDNWKEPVSSPDAPPNWQRERGKKKPVHRTMQPLRCGRLCSARPMNHNHRPLSRRDIRAAETWPTVSR